MGRVWVLGAGLLPCVCLETTNFYTYSMKKVFSLKLGSGRGELLVASAGCINFWSGQWF
jgi:hypothetical protein